MDAWQDMPATRDPTEAGASADLLIGALRRLAIGQKCATLARHDFALAFPGDGAEVFATFRAFLCTIAHATRRKLRIGLPGSPQPTPDETLLVALVAAAQTGDDDLVDAHLCWLARAEARCPVALTLRALATALAVHGHWLQAPLSCHSAVPQHSEPGADEHEPAKPG
jgi:hypothetical protein